MKNIVELAISSSIYSPLRDAGLPKLTFSNLRVSLTICCYLFMLLRDMRNDF